jgi:DNA-binding helix-hairpin-helix protein with protein kinase domain
MFDKETREASAFVTFITVWWWALILILGILGTAVYLLLWPTYNNLWIKGYRTTNEYQTTKADLIYKLIDQYNRNEVKIAEIKSDPNNAEVVRSITGQQIGLLTRIRKEAQLLKDAGAIVPQGVQDFLFAHGGE